MSISSIGSQSAHMADALRATAQRPDPEAQRAAVNAQADLLNATRLADLPQRAVAAVSDGQGVDLYL